MHLSRCIARPLPEAFFVLVTFRRFSQLLIASSVALAASGAQAPTSQRDSLVGIALRWREIGPYRAGRARAVTGSPAGGTNVAYIGFDNGGVWRSTDFGSNWQPLFDNEPTGSIGAIAVPMTDPNIIYVGTGAGIIRPDLAMGNGMYKSTDAGKTWTHLGLDDTWMIAQIDIDPTNPARLFVAALGHPYGPNAERGIFRSTDGGQTFEKVLYKDEYTSGNDVRIDPVDPKTVYAALWQQQQSYLEGGSFGGTSGGIFKSTDGGTTWRQLTEGLPNVLQANLALAPSNPKVVYAMVAGQTAAARGPEGFGGGTVALYRSSDGGEHWTMVQGQGVQGHAVDTRPLARIGGGDLPTLAVDPTNENVVYSASVVMWRSEDGGATWSAVRGAPGGDDYQKVWVSPVDPKVIVAVSDQGGVVSANRGESWSNWYTQPTAAMYHVTTDNTFAYRVCSGQQDSGSACVKSRSNDGEITFHDWHPVNIQEYGEAAPDPRNPDEVYGSARTGVSLYDRTTGQTTSVGPSTEQRGTQYGRNVRTMPILWSPLRPDVLYYASNVVWKSTDHAHSWTRISPDLARQTWSVPASVGKYASQVTPSAQGSITGFSASPRNPNVLWAGTDDGNIQVTRDGGAHWTNVTPAAIKPWTRIFNLDAGHFDDGTAYAAANTMRIDDNNPHFWRTHDGGKTWTEIDNGIAPGNVANSIREDPRTPGLLYAATDQQVWVSFDDGNDWRSLRLNMPAISVRDLEVKDDSTCLCSDLVAGTHGRGFWILDNVTPLRQAAQAGEAQHAGDAYLYRPATAVRVRFGTNDPTPWPPEVPAGENPPPGALIDYSLPPNAHDVRIEILDAKGKVVRHYASSDPVMDPHPALDPGAYNRVCQQRPTAPFCGLPLYWPAPPMIISTRPGMHRMSWDMRYQPIGDAGVDEEGGAAVPYRTYPNVNAPWAAPGRYSVRLTVDGKSYTQPLMLRMDPRVKTSAAVIGQVSAVSREMYDDAVAANALLGTARAFASSLDTTSADAAKRKLEIDSIAPPAVSAPTGRRGFRARGAATAGPTFESVGSELLNAAMAMQSADVAPTSAQLAAVTKARADWKAIQARWLRLRGR
ncbi:MAG TPA: hypothetical protein VF159_03180 [Gemmatimonadaceae bacterium]